MDDFEVPDGPIPILLSAPILLGSGVAIRIQSPELGRLRTAARQAMSGEFSKQDSQGWRPHVTIQNRVPAAAAKQLYRAMENGFEQGAAILMPPRDDDVVVGFVQRVEDEVERLGARIGVLLAVTAARRAAAEAALAAA